MIKRKVKWLWSYNVDKTEQWLMVMAKSGWHLVSVNQWTRTFIFKKGEQKNVTYYIQYVSKNHSFPSTLQKEGWSIAYTAGKWLFLLNEEPIVRLYPTRDALVKRNRAHAYMTSLLAILYISFTMQPLLLMGILNSVIGDGNIFSHNFWVFLLLITGIIAVACFAIYVFRAYRRFEIREMDSTLDSSLTGKKMRKFKGGWMYKLEETKKWLENQAGKGYELESVKAAVFTFRKTNPTNIKYECTFEYKVQPSYFATHKELGWQLKFSSNMTLLNYSIWAMHYEKEEEIPQFSYDKLEQRQSIKRGFKMGIAMSIYLILLLSFSIYMNILVIDEPFLSWSFFGVVRGLLIVFF